MSYAKRRLDDALCERYPEPPEPTMDVQKKFEEQLELAKEENPLLPLEDQLKLAVDWTINDVTNLIVRLAEQRKWAHIEAVNQHIEATSGRFA